MKILPVYTTPRFSGTKSTLALTLYWIGVLSFMGMGSEKAWKRPGYQVQAEALKELVTLDPKRLRREHVHGQPVVVYQDDTIRIEVGQTPTGKLYLKSTPDHQYQGVKHTDPTIQDDLYAVWQQVGQ